MQQNNDLRASMLLQMEDTENLMNETLDLIEHADKIYQEFKKVRKNIKYLYDELDEAQAREPGSVSHFVLPKPTGDHDGYSNKIN